MPEQRRTVFISCGQYSLEERELGDQVCKLVGDSTPFQGYFAQNQVSLKTLTENVLQRLYASVGLIAIMHCRGTVETLNGKFERGSVWIEQEIAIAALMEQVLRRNLHVALFIQKGIELEGIRKQLHLNSFSFETSEEVLARLRTILPDWKEPLYIPEDELQKQADAVELSIKVLRGWNLSLTVEVRNLSDVPVEIKSIVLRSHDVKLCEPVRRPEGANWTIRPNAGGPIQFGTNEDIGLRLIGIYGKQQLPAVPNRAVFGPQNRFSAVISVELRCAILGLERKIPENCSVEVNLVTREINSL